MARAAFEAKVAALREHGEALRLDEAAGMFHARLLDLEARGLEGRLPLDREDRIDERHVETLALGIARRGDRPREVRWTQPRMPLRRIDVRDAPLRLDAAGAPVPASLRAAAPAQCEARVGHVHVVHAAFSHPCKATVGRDDRDAATVRRPGLGVDDVHRPREAIARRLQ